MLPYATSYASGYNATSNTKLSASDMKNVLQWNMKAFRKRVRKRIDHMDYVSKL